MFTYVTCTCGRNLRSQRSSERVTIRCWDCGREVSVRPYHAGGENPIVAVRRVLDTSQLEAFAAFVLMAMGTVAVLLVPRSRGLAGFAVMAAIAMLYLNRIEEPGRDAEAAVGKTERPRRLGETLARWLMATGVAVGMILPFWLADGSHQYVATPPPLPAPLMWPVAVGIWVLVALAAFLATARDEAGRLGFGRGLVALARRPWAAMGALLVFPLTVVVLEAAIFGGLLAAHRSLECFVADLFPLPPGTHVRYEAILTAPNMMYDSPKPWISYLEGLERGATLVGSIPLSMARGLEAKILPRAYGISSRESYLIARLALAVVVLFVMYCALGWQSRWLGSISQSAPEPTAKSSRPSARVPDNETEPEPANVSG